jgi:hypothetical protein
MNLIPLVTKVCATIAVAALLLALALDYIETFPMSQAPRRVMKMLKGPLIRAEVGIHGRTGRPPVKNGASHDDPR